MNSNSSEQQPRLVSCGEAARDTGVCVRTIRNLIDRGTLEPRRIGRRLMVTRESLDRLIENGTEAA